MSEPIVRHYKGDSKAAAEAAYRNDAAQAYRAGYIPVGHRWEQDWSGHTLSVAYRLESEVQAPAVTSGVADEQRAAGQPQSAGEPPSAGEPQSAGRPQQIEQPQQIEHPAPAERAQPAPPPAPASGHSLRRARLAVQTLDLHCAGEPLRIVRSGFPEVPHAAVLERRRWVRDNADHLRRTIVHEPRGHRDMYGAVLLPPWSADADVCLLFMHNEGYSTMCGHGVIAVTVGLIEEGLYPAREPQTTIRYEVPAGLVTATAETSRAPDGGWIVESVRFTNVPAYLHARTLPVVPDGVELHGRAAEAGQLSVDLAYGGAYYGVVDAAELGLRVVPEQADALRRAGAAITDVLRRDHTPAHPTDADLGFVYGTIIVDRDPPTSPDGRATNAHLRNATIFADAELDRSPCGSGTSALLAQLHARGHLRPGHEIANAGITGEAFLGRIDGETMLGNYPAVITSVAGTAYVVGYSTLIVDGRDPLGEGFVLS